MFMVTFTIAALSVAAADDERRRAWRFFTRLSFGSGDPM
jgi:hypothetical protein